MRTQILGCPVDILSRAETIGLARRSMSERTPCMHVSLNVAKLVNSRTDADLARDVASADIVGIDGMGITLAMRLLGHSEAPRLAGADLFADLMEVCAREGFRPFLLGAKQDVLDEAMKRREVVCLHARRAVEFSLSHAWKDSARGGSTNQR